MLYYRDDSWVPDVAVFDCDGILLDSEVKWEAVQNRLFAEYGVVPTPELEASLVGSSAADFARELARLSLPVGADEQAHFERILAVVHEAEFTIIDDGVDLIPGARETVAKLASVMPVAVASNSSSALLQRKVEAYEYVPLLTTWVGANDVAAPKPAPDMYLEAVRRLGGVPECAVTFEDSNAGARAAQAAGTRTFVFVRDADSPESAPRGNGYFSSFEDPAFVALVDSWVAAKSHG